MKLKKKTILLVMMSCFISNIAYSEFGEERISQDYIDNYKPFCKTIFIDYYMNGTIKMKGCQGSFNAAGTIIGSTYEYDDSGRLMQKTYYHPDKYGKDYKIVTQYDKKEKIVSKKIFNNDALYETEEIELNEIPR